MLVPLGTATALMCVMAAKHFCADFLFQTAWIARGKAGTDNWVLPLMLHAGGHAALTLLIALLLYPKLWWFAPLELVVHAVIDRAKAVVGRRAALDAGQAEFWWLLGFDQFLHHLTNILIVSGFLALGTPHP
ncbi:MULTISPECIES: DUF3307 domain-containing protein [Lichenihabitans]|uniref:DUF3307 domain-containing protein n=1 Tax=Lichenihabitans TaxID=2723776 RepID=UPI0010365924|nr:MULTISPECIES: DUF3307 domain-containing protein [Lichenihabitans]UDL94711.1 DUF3307 domain-containing protein [Lichenihabitans sp. PAMC28606]